MLFYGQIKTLTNRFNSVSWGSTHVELQHTTEKNACNIWTGPPVPTLFKRKSLWFPFTVHCSKIANKLCSFLLSGRLQIVSCLTPTCPTKFMSMEVMAPPKLKSQLFHTIHCYKLLQLLSLVSSSMYFSGFLFQIEFELIFQLTLYPFVGYKTSLFGFWYYFSNTAEHFRKHWVHAKYIHF